MREKVGKSPNTVFFSMIWGSGGSKSRLAKAAGAEPARQIRDEKVHAVVARSTCGNQNVQNTPESDHFWKLPCRKSARRCGAKHISKSKCTKHTMLTTFGSWDVEKVHAVVARSTCGNQNVQNTPESDHFWKLPCRKSARRCGAKHISKSKCTKHTMLGPLLEVEMSKKCTPLWRETHFQVKMYKTHHARTTFGSWDVDKVHAVVARSTFPSQNVQNTRGSDHFWKLRCRKSARRCGAKHISKSKCTKHTMLAPLLEVEMSKKCTPLWREAHFQLKMYKALHVRATFGGSDVASPLRFTTLHYFTLHHTPLYYTTLHYTTLHNTTTTQLDYTELHSTKVHFTTLRSATVHYITLHSTTLHYAPQHYNYTTTLHYTPLH